MTDPLSIAASITALATAAITSANSLNSTVTRYKNRNKTLQRLQNELEELGSLLKTLEELASANASILSLLKKPVDRCGQVCREFEKCMETFCQKTKTGFRDWAKLEFMRGNINDFVEVLAGYKSTISIGIGIITMRTSTLTQKVLEEFGELIKDTVESLNDRLQRIEEMTATSSQTAESLHIDIDLTDEKAVTEQCIRICEDASSYIEKLVQEPPIQLPTPPDTVTNVQAPFGAQLQTQASLKAAQAGIVENIVQLQARLQAQIQDPSPKSESERLRLREDIDSARQCLELCNMADKEVTYQKIHRVGQAIVDGGSDQVVVTSVADLFDVKKAISKNKSAQLIATISDEAFMQTSRDRYTSRFGAVSPERLDVGNLPTTTNTARTDSHSPRREGKASAGIHVETRRPNPNEVRKRVTDETID